MHEEVVRDKGKSHTRQNLGQIFREGGQDQARAREPIGAEGSCHSMASSERIEIAQRNQPHRDPGGPAGDQWTMGGWVDVKGGH
jgi:hypothetical protein